MITSNMNVTFVPFHWAHPSAMDMRPFERAYYKNLPDYQDRLKMYAQCGQSLTAICDGEIACCFGAIPIWPGVAEAWLLTSYMVDTRAVSLTRGAIRYFNNICSEMSLHRLQITVDCANDVAIRWAKALNFTQEGVMRKYGPDGSDHIMFARIP